MEILFNLLSSYDNECHNRRRLRGSNEKELLKKVKEFFFINEVYLN